jgi:hypothetical protein
MTEPSVTLAELRESAQDCDGKTLRTLCRQAEFVLHCDPDRGLQYTPRSTGKPRSQTWRQIERVLDKFERLGSWKPGDYSDISANASYLLAVMKEATRGEVGASGVSS